VRNSRKKALRKRKQEIAAPQAATTRSTYKATTIATITAQTRD